MASDPRLQDPCYLRGKRRLKSDSVSTEALRLARNEVIDELRRRDIKMKWVESSEITLAATTLIGAEYRLIRKARRNIKRRSALAARLRGELL